MKFLAFADMHGNRKQLEKLVRRAKKEKVDFIVCAGDISIFERRLNEMLSVLGKSKLPVFIIPGNHESDSLLAKLSKKHKLFFLHKKIFEIDGFFIAGFGGGGFSLTDRDFEKTAKKFYKVFKKNRNFILITHAPPYRTKVDLIGRSHCGNKSIANFIKLSQPLVAISGHLHETEGKKDKIGKTLVVNPGMKGMVIEL
ncbi:MAG: metallophosphoesterase [Nanoarchaeota archaeon]|nr:metallophosphoesterase [Nanoarchaeota archaeon]